MKVYIFGNGPSPALAIYGLRRAIIEGAPEHGEDTLKFVERHFYVDDGLVSVPLEAGGKDLLQRTQASLAESNLCLHMFVSNCQAVKEFFLLNDYPSNQGLRSERRNCTHATELRPALGDHF